VGGEENFTKFEIIVKIRFYLIVCHIHSGPQNIINFDDEMKKQTVPKFSPLDRYV